MVSSWKVHPASLVNAAIHSPALLELLEVNLSRPVIGALFQLSTPLHDPDPMNIRVFGRLRD